MDAPYEKARRPPRSESFRRIEEGIHVMSSPTKARINLAMKDQAPHANQ